MASTLASFAGCSIGVEQTNETDATAQATYLIGSPGETEDFEFGVAGINSFDVTTDYGETMHYLLVNVTYTNLTDKEQDISKRNIDFYLDNEAVRVVKSMPNWKPGYQDGKAVRVKFCLPINFRLQ
jgi:hypothetical protein